MTTKLSRMSRAGLDKDPHDVASMFDGVAKGYDRTNTVMTLGFDRRWREITRQVLDAAPGERVLDLAAGTAVSTVEYARSGAWCLAADFSLGMLRGGAHRDVPKVAADALHLPFTNGVFDAVTVSFGLRNMNDTGAALREMARVVRPGGRLVVCEVSQPRLRPIRWLYRNTVLRTLGWRDVEWLDLTLGAVALHRAVRP
jgi:demethylmenaquinone methyltransferase/2-methoxy-6-polyprenyl-1,4-benzoquinol methylase